MGRIHLSLSLFLVASLAHAAAPGPMKLAFRPDVNAPLQQSKCEVRSNKIMAAHPHLDMFKLMNRYSVFIFGEAPPPGPPSVYRDAKSGIFFYAESDGRHVAAIDDHEKVLWVRDPYVDSDMCPYRSAHPFIMSIGPVDGGRGESPADAEIRTELLREIKAGRKAAPPQVGDRFLSLTFNSSNFGYLNIRNGDFYEMGQN